MARAKLLLIEDDVTLVKMYERKFESDGYEVSVAYDGQEGLKKAFDEKPVRGDGSLSTWRLVI